VMHQCMLPCAGNPLSLLPIPIPNMGRCNSLAPKAWAWMGRRVSRRTRAVLSTPCAATLAKQCLKLGVRAFSLTFQVLVSSRESAGYAAGVNTQESPRERRVRSWCQHPLI